MVKKVSAPKLVHPSVFKQLTVLDNASIRAADESIQRALFANAKLRLVKVELFAGHHGLNLNCVPLMATLSRKAHGNRLFHWQSTS